MMSTEIKYLTETEQKESISFILDQGLPLKKPFSSHLKEIFIGPGLPAIFYCTKLTFAGSTLIYLLLFAAFHLLGGFGEKNAYMAILLFPLLNMIFHTISCWADGQDGLIELKESLYYSFYHIVSLRMFYFSMFSAGLNTVIFLCFGHMESPAKVCIIGLSSLFLFSAATLFLYQRYNVNQTVLITALVWGIFCLGGIFLGDRVHILLFKAIPFAAHLIMLLVSFGLFVYYIGKIGEKHAYTCKYQ